MYARVEDLRKGDVVIISTSKGLFEAKLLRQPVPATQGKLTTWYGQPRWKTVLCAVREETLTRTYTYGAGHTSTYNYTRTVVAGVKEYNKEKRIDFTDRDCWIIKREQI